MVTDVIIYKWYIYIYTCFSQTHRPLFEPASCTTMMTFIHTLNNQWPMPPNHSLISQSVCLRICWGRNIYLHSYLLRVCTCLQSMVSMKSSARKYMCIYIYIYWRNICVLYQLYHVYIYISKTWLGHARAPFWHHHFTTFLLVPRSSSRQLGVTWWSYDAFIF